MRIFCKKILCFGILFAVICVGMDFLSLRNPWKEIIAKQTRSEEYISDSVGSDEIKPYIEKVRLRDRTTILILGDSVCNQMFGSLQDLNNDICIAGTNSAITMAGQYILAKEYIENHENASAIYLFLLPGSLEVTFTTTLGYQYTVMPFVETNTLSILDIETITKMQSVYGKTFMKRNVVEIIDQSAVNRKLYLNLLNQYQEDYHQISRYEIADQYLKKIYEICDQKGIELYLIPGPVAETQKEYTKQKMQDYAATWMYSAFPDYAEKILFIPDMELPDGVHFGGEAAVQSHYNDIIKILFEDTPLIRKIRFE